MYTMRIGPNLSFAMVASLAFLGIVRALTIDNQLMLIKNDCYERLAIGQRINSKTVYKSFDYNTLKDCQMACTEQKNACRAFSFGVGTKGNGSCELSADAIKETGDLKPIGTVADTDYDLYIKKLGCSVVIDKSPHSKPLSSDSKPIGSLEHGYGDSRPSDTRPPQNPYEKPPFGSNYPSHHYLPPNGDEVHHVQSLVSVASGPQSYLHPLHDILVGENPYHYGKLYGGKYYESPKSTGGCCEKPAKSCCSNKDDAPPFKPQILNHPYDDFRDRYPPRPDEGRPDTGYDPRRGDYSRFSGYDDRGPPKRPIGPVMRPDYDRYDTYRPDRPDRPDGDRAPDTVNRPDYDKFDGYIPSRPNNDRYDDRPLKKHFRPEPQDLYLRPNFDNYVDPLPPRYGSLIPHPDEYNRPQDNYIPENNRYGTRPSNRPNYDRPSDQGQEYPSYHYEKPTRPLPDSQIYDTTKPEVTQQTPKPNDGYDKPNKPARPLDPDDPNAGYAYDKPEGGNQLSYDGEKGSGSKVSHSIGPHGQQITSIITEIKQTCFRRVLAGKRVARRCVKRSLTCETVEACQRECADEKYFICEGFNYRIDPTGRGKGDCELLDVPLSRLDIRRDLYPDPDYDYYERDRNAVSAKCKQWSGQGYSPYPINSGGYGGGRRDGYQYPRGSYGYNDRNRNKYFIDRRYDGPQRPDYKGDRRPVDYDTGLRRPGDKWTEDGYYDRPRARPEADRRFDDYRPSANRRGGKYLPDSILWDVLCVRYK